MASDHDLQRTEAAIMTIAAGGPLEGVVTLTAIQGGQGRWRIEVAWTEQGTRHTDHVEIDSIEDAQIIAHGVVDEMKAGHRPDLTRD